MTVEQEQRWRTCERVATDLTDAERNLERTRLAADSIDEVLGNKVYEALLDLYDAHRRLDTVMGWRA